MIKMYTEPLTLFSVHSTEYANNMASSYLVVFVVAFSPTKFGNIMALGVANNYKLFQRLSTLIAYRSI